VCPEKKKEVSPLCFSLDYHVQIREKQTKRRLISGEKKPLPHIFPKFFSPSSLTPHVFPDWLLGLLSL